MICDRCKAQTYIIKITKNHRKLCPLCFTPMGKLRKKQSSFVKKVALLILYAYEQGYELTFGDAYAKGGHMVGSLHYSRLAIDLQLFKNGVYLTETKDYAQIGAFWESLSPECVWGGSFGESKKGAGDGYDGNHFQFSSR